MAKKEEVRKSLKAGEYWEWRTTISELDLAKSNYQISELEFKLMHKDAEVLVTKAQLFAKTRVEGSKQALQDAHAEYTRFKTFLEKEVGQTLSGKLIDDVTFEIKELPEEPKK